MPIAVPDVAMVSGQLGLLDGATDIPVSVVLPQNAEPALFDAYREHGAERALVSLSTHSEAETLRSLDRIAPLIETYR
ncbi:hypothetical protein B1790_33990 [Mycobacterium sp. AT1]|nr:hypothetical protein B1790_33990 [Mycobacterium sp. AT1]